MCDVDETSYRFCQSGMEPLDRVLGGGLVLGAVVLIGGEPGSGKCLGKGTDVLMFDGRTIPVERVARGDRLMGPDGRPRTVLTTTRGIGDLYRITPIKGDPWICNGAHVLTLVHSLTNKVSDMPLEDWLAAAPRSRMRAKSKLFHVGVDNFEGRQQSLPIDPYFLGLWFGDGTKEVGPIGLKKIQITKPDREVKDACDATAKEWGLTVSVLTSTSGCPQYSLVNKKGSGNPLLSAMRPLLGHGLTMPESYTRAPRASRLEFLAGLLDSDGDLGTNCFNISQKREDWAREVWWMARSLGLMSTIAPKRGRCKRRDGSFFEGDYWIVCIFGNTDMIPTRIARKVAHRREQKKDALRTGFSVEKTGRGVYFGFELDGDGRFLLGDFTVTHNSTLCTQWLDGLARMEGLSALYASGEEGINQVGARARRVSADHPKIQLVAETSLDVILDHAQRKKVSVLLIDSVQTIECDGVAGSAGSVTQLRECTHRLIKFAKTPGEERAVILICQVNSDGSLAGPKMLKHLVDILLEFEAGEGAERILYCPGKNRYGESGRRGRFLITRTGLEPAPFESTEPDGGPVNSFH